MEGAAKENVSDALLVLRAEVVALEQALEVLHATDANFLRRRHASLKQHVAALSSEVAAFKPLPRRVSGHSSARIVDLLLAASAGGAVTLLPRVRWAAAAALALLAAAYRPMSSRIDGQEADEDLLAQWTAVRDRCDIMRSLLADDDLVE